MGYNNDIRNLYKIIIRMLIQSMPPRTLDEVRRLVDEALAHDQVVLHPHARASHHFTLGDARMVLMHGSLGYGKTGPEGERYTADMRHPVVNEDVRAVFSIQGEGPATVLVITLYERWKR